MEIKDITIHIRLKNNVFSLPHLCTYNMYTCIHVRVEAGTSVSPCILPCFIPSLFFYYHVHQASWPTTFQEFSRVQLPSHWRAWTIDTSYHMWFYVLRISTQVHLLVWQALSHRAISPTETSLFLYSSKKNKTNQNPRKVNM